MLYLSCNDIKIRIDLILEAKRMMESSEVENCRLYRS